MADVSVRAALPDDAEEIGRIQVVTWQVSYANLLPAPVLDALSAEQATKIWRDAISTPPSSRHHVLVAKEQDWTVGFAAVALATIAQDVPEARKEVTELYRAILGNTPTTGHTPYVAPVIISYLAVPRISDGEREELQALLAKLTQVETVVEAVHDEDDDDVGYAPGDE